MSTTHGRVPARPLDPGVLKGLYAERVAQNAEWQKAAEIAPVYTVGQTSGSMPIDGTYRGIDLQADPDIATAKSYTGEDYGNVKIQLDSEDYKLERYTLGKYERSYLAAKTLYADNGVEEEALVSRIFADRAASLHAHKLYTALGTTGNYATGYQADPGNITSPSFSMISLINTAGNALIESQSWSEGQPIDIIVGNDVLPYIQKLDEFRDKSGNANSNYPTPDELAAWFAAYMPGARLRRANGTHVNESGVKTRYLSGAICFSVPRPTPMSRGHVLTLGLDSVSDAMLDLRVTPNGEHAGGGEDVYADAFYKVHVENINGGGSTSGYLAHTLLT